MINTNNIPCVREVAPRLKLYDVAEHEVSEPFIGPCNVLKFVRNYMQDLAEENIIVLNVDKRNRILNMSRVSTGTIDATYSTGREVLKTAVLSNASAIIMAHNHPSGDPNPSDQDIKITEKMVRCGYLMDIPLLDHIIVGSNGRSYSFLVDGRVMFNEMTEKARKEFRSE